MSSAPTANAVTQAARAIDAGSDYSAICSGPWDKSTRAATAREFSSWSPCWACSSSGRQWAIGRTSIPAQREGPNRRDGSRRRGGRCRRSLALRGPILDRHRCLAGALAASSACRSRQGKYHVLARFPEEGPMIRRRAFEDAVNKFYVEQRQDARSWLGLHRRRRHAQHPGDLRRLCRPRLRPDSAAGDPRRRWSRSRRKRRKRGPPDALCDVDLLASAPDAPGH